jgi:hypothetical protein
MTALPLLLSLLAGQTCTPVSATPRVPTLVVYGDSRMQGNLCGSTSPVSPPEYLDINLPGGTAAGWFVKNSGVSGSTPAQIRTAYTAAEATACNGERCGHLVLNGGVNCLRAGTAAATCIADMVWIVDDALAKGYVVVWLDETDYSLWASAGANPGTQVAAYNLAWQTACDARASNTRLKCLANYTALGVPLQNTCDGVHMNQTGTNLLGSRILTALQSIP